jgi:putative hydrolase of the HAD superfamily
MTQRTSGIPWGEIETLFLDAGNTLISIDFAWVGALLAERGVAVDPAGLSRAEAAARPSLSEWLGGRRSTEDEETFRFYVRNVLERLGPVAERGPGAAGELADALVPLLRRRGEANRLWRTVMPGVPEALARFRELGLQLVVVSNSDGSCERGLEAAGLRSYFDAVLDSTLVGYEKPDPRFFEQALAAAGTPPERVVHVGDLFHVDVRGARAAGIHPVLLDPHGDWPELGCERVRDLGELAVRLAASRGGAAQR